MIYAVGYLRGTISIWMLPLVLQRLSKRAGYSGKCLDLRT